MKHCNQCENDYNLDFFYSYPNGKKRSICKQCSINNTIHYRESKKEKNEIDQVPKYFNHDRYRDFYKLDRITQRNRNIKK